MPKFAKRTISNGIIQFFKIPKIRSFFLAVGMGQQVKALETKPGNLSLIPMSHVVKGEN